MSSLLRNSTLETVVRPFPSDAENVGQHRILQFQVGEDYFSLCDGRWLPISSLTEVGRARKDKQPEQVVGVPQEGHRCLE